MIKMRIQLIRLTKHIRTSAVAFIKTYLALSVCLLIGGGISPSFAESPTLSTHANTANDTNQRIIALAPNIVEILFELGVGEQIVGVSEHTDFPDAAKTIPTVANYLGIQLEAVVQSQPDLIIVWEGGTSDRDIQKLKSLGFHIHTFSANSINELINQIKNLGVLVGKAGQAQRLVSKLQEQHQALETTKVTLSKSKRVGFVEIWPAPLTSAGGKTIIGQAMKYCGLTNIFENAGNTYPQVSLEKVLVAKPDVIIQPVSLSNPTETKDWSQLTMIPAVKSQAVIQPNSDALFRWGPRLPSEIQKMCEQIQKVIKTK